MACVGLFRQVAFEFERDDVSKAEADWFGALKELFDQYPALVIELRGHADARERRASALSARRARAVRDALVQMGIRPEGLVPVGCGSVVPVAEKGNASNRRVEFVLVAGVPDEEICTPRPSECPDIGE
jgi:OOP family OmpA-OmpF porin